ncbi:MAG: extracellular solute-binding protein [Lachnospiraceae bacterium]|nr:extracellular solute-binding protein [Lachnospiraceae bacterium]
MKKVIPILIIIAAMLASCGNQTQTADNSITIWTNFRVEASLLQEYAEIWSGISGIQANVINTSIEVQKFAQAANTADGPDGIFGIPNDQMATFVAANLAAVVPDDFDSDDDYVKASIQASYVDGKRYGVPIAVETISLFYNTDKVAIPPATWDELLIMAESGTGIKFDATSIYYNLGFVRAYGGYIFQWTDNAYDVYDIGVGNEGAILAYGYLMDMVERGLLSADITFDIARSAFENGETAFFIGGPWDVDAFNNVGLNFAVIPMPSINGRPFITPVGTQVGFVSAKSSKQDSVWDFYRFLIDEAMVDLYYTGSRIPALEKAQKELEMDANADGFLGQIEVGEPLPSVPELGHLWVPYTNNMRLMYSGQITPEEAGYYINEQLKESIAIMHEGK